MAALPSACAGPGASALPATAKARNHAPGAARLGDRMTRANNWIFIAASLDAEYTK
jgi:hypothetical protein